MDAPPSDIVVIEDDEAFANVLAHLLRTEHHRVRLFTLPMEGLASVMAGPCDLVVTDYGMEGLDGLDVLQQIKKRQPDLPVIVVSGTGGVNEAVALMKAGAYEYLTKPVQSELFLTRCTHALRERHLARELSEARLRSPRKADMLVGSGAAHHRLMQQVEMVAKSDVTVAVHGESGVGKELVARMIHMRSARKDGPFVAVNCAALPEPLLESELFGHARGAFTGADREREGLFRAAQGGTLLLDEIGEMPLGLQAKLLRVLQFRRVRPVGASADLEVDARIVTTTHRDLQRAVAEGRFREDLFYRVNVVPIEVPPLRARLEDVPLIARALVDVHRKRIAPDVTGIDATALRILAGRDWPGNVRQLENVVQQAMVMCGSGVIEPRHLPGAAAPDPGAARKYKDAKQEVVDGFERRYATEVLRQTGGNISQAARVAGLDRKSFWKLLRRHGLTARAEPAE